MPRIKKKQFCYDYPRPAVTVDTVIVTAGPSRQVLLIRRRNEPFAGQWALPGGFVDMEETLEKAARRELYEETGMKTKKLVQLGTFGDPGRDPRGRTISIVYLAEIPKRNDSAKAGDDAGEVGWFSLAQLPPLAFDHLDILKLARKYLRSKIG